MWLVTDGTYHVGLTWNYTCVSEHLPFGTLRSFFPFHILSNCKCNAMRILATIFAVTWGRLIPLQQDCAKVLCTFMLSSCLKHHVKRGER